LERLIKISILAAASMAALVACSLMVISYMAAAMDY
jgi:hypothetical protein